MALPVVYRQAARLEILNAARLHEAQRIVVLACLDLRRDPEAIAAMATARRDQ